VSFPCSRVGSLALCGSLGGGAVDCCSPLLGLCFLLVLVYFHIKLPRVVDLLCGVSRFFVVRRLNGHSSSFAFVFLFVVMFVRPVLCLSMLVALEFRFSLVMRWVGRRSSSFFFSLFFVMAFSAFALWPSSALRGLFLKPYGTLFFPWLCAASSCFFSSFSSLLLLSAFALGVGHMSATLLCPTSNVCSSVIITHTRT